ncbi:hypothetical protein NLG97_g6947 [Lecanicillium saksenae]|uniref:Uncharacterized protein n=1 Tax=Lecanicillium saksenae TaxID=468837 RepID=A0ACC1QPG8_9HYPO|nr:hypothetical protein NLG97_g6947 [Lecanicillium saksenae]
MIYTILADVTTKAQRSTAFLYLSGILTTCGLVANPLTSLMMNGLGAWFTVYSGFVLMSLSLILVTTLPETRSAAVVKQAEAARNAERVSNASTEGKWWDIRPMLRAAWTQIVVINQTLFVGNPRVGTLLLSTVFFTVGKCVMMLMLQYVTKRFGWTWAKAGLIAAVKNVASLVLTVAILPAVSQLLLKSGMAPLFKDWWIARASALISAVGMLVTGMAPTIPLFIAALVFTECGGGLQPALCSVVTELVDKRHVALVMTVLSISLTVSEMVAGPVMAQTFNAGLYLGGIWVVDKLKPRDPRVKYFTAPIRGKTYGYMVAEPTSTPIDTILLVHGFPDFSFGWRYQIPHLLSLGYKVIAPDALGYATTDAPQELEAYSGSSLADDIADLGRYIVGPNAKLIVGGHDMGGQISWQVAIRHPQLVKAVFSVCTPILEVSDTYSSLKDMIAAGKWTHFGYQLQFAGADVEEKIQGREKILWHQHHVGCQI